MGEQTMIAKLLYEYTANLPARLIDINGKPYLERYLVARVGGLRIYLHRFVRDDSERAVHDHPWRWACAFVLAGRYKERLATMDDPTVGHLYKHRWVRWFNWISPRTRHQIVSVRPETWTLFITGKRIKGWGFYQHIEHGYYYHQPFDTKASAAWYDTAPTGEKVGRMAFTQ